jgi:acetoin utilization deacetylase AcuC-like enzyme
MHIPVFYTSKMVSDSGSFSPSSAKPAKVVESWGKQYPIQLIEPTPVTVDDYCKVHDRNFVEGVLSCKADNGFGNKSREVAAALPYTSGSMFCAALHALVSKKVAV